MPPKIDPDKKRSDKLLLLYAVLLFNNREYTVKELASEEYLNCSATTISNLIKDLKNMCIGNLKVRRENKCLKYRLEPSQITSNVSINAEGFAQLALCREFLIGLLPEDMQHKIRTSLDQAITYCTNETDNIPHGIGGFLSKGRIDYTPFRIIIENIISAIEKKKVCLLTYHSTSKAAPKTYHFAPKRMLIFHEGLYVEGYHVNDHGKVELKYEDTSRLAIQRIKELAITERSSADLKDVPIPDNKAFGFIRDEPIEATIRFAPEVATYVEEREWCESQTIAYDENNYLILKLNINNIDECISWVLTFRENAEILEPDWLRREISETITAMKRCYWKKDPT